MACQTRFGVAGISMCATPSGRSASRMASTMMGGEAHRTGFPDALDAQRIGAAGDLEVFDGHRREIIGAWHAAVTEAAREQLAFSIMAREAWRKAAPPTIDARAA